MDGILLKLKALADKNRLRIFSVLARHDELCACQITEMLQVTGATASRHLKLLTHSGLLKSRKESRWVFFSLDRGCGGVNDVMGWILPRLQDAVQFKDDLNTLDRIMKVPREDLCRKQRGDVCCPVKKEEAAHG